ncbi:hypothetical protein I4U23_016541 [Adineta vaga]|nr:hypothetical protein I4U23_016541 [Adineta vaga]
MVLAVNELFEICKKQYIDNERNLAIVNELETAYSAENAIEWYTKDTFVYRVVNRALRQQDVDTLILFSFLIRDINKQLQDEQHFIDDSIKTYRGQLMCQEELERLQISKGQFISINTFFSTTLNRDLALIFAGSENTDMTKKSVCFEITVNTRLSATKPFAAIDHLSAFGNGEEEVLFMAGSIFKLNDISMGENDNIWMINIELVNDEVDELKSLFESMKNEIAQETDFLSLGNLFRVRGKIDEAEKYFKREIRSVPEHHPNSWRCCASLGNIAADRGRFDQAYDYLTAALELAQNSPLLDRGFIGGIYTNLGVVLTAIEDYENACNHYSKALEITVEVYGNRHLYVADIYLNMGNVYAEQHNYDLGLSNYNKCLDIKQILLPDDHPAIAQILVNIGNILRKQQKWNLSLVHYQNALSIQLKSIPNHTYTGTTYLNIGRLYNDAFENYSEAMDNYENALMIYSSAFLPSDHPNCILLEKLIHKCKTALEANDEKNT